MSTAPAPTLDSYDDRGLSIVTSTMTATDPRRGTVYRPDVLAAGMPVYYHPLQNGNYLALFAFRWIDATGGTTGPQSYTTHTVSNAPCAVEVDVVSGRAGQVYDLPVPAHRTLTGACGRNDNFWTVGQDDDGNAVIGSYRVTERSTVLLQNEEVVPPVHGVTFSSGCLFDETHLIVFGTGGAGKVYAARKNWSRIGSSGGTDAVWTYSTAKGWETPYTDDDGVEHHPLNDPTSPLGPTTVGPVSGATRWGRVWLSTVDQTGDIFTAKVWTGKTLTATKPVATSIALGGPTTYLGGGLFFQPQVNASLALSATPAVPYVTSVRGVSGVERSIQNDWGLQSVS